MCHRLPSFCVALLLIALACSNAAAIEKITIRKDGKDTVIAGKVEVEAEDGGVLLQGTDGQLWLIPKEELAAREKDDTPFTPLNKEEVAKQLEAELPKGFRILHTKHYTIGYNTSVAYAQWVGSLYERLYGSFYAYWEKKGVKLQPPQFPLVALVFDSQASYAEFTRSEIGEGTKTIIGYYSLKSNRINMYDLTGVEELGRDGPRGNSARINAILSQPGAERTVATIVHEATHQLAFNSGLQTRFADIPFWVSEGLAIYFESPDLKSVRGWTTVGAVNRYNLLQFRARLATRPAGALEEMLTDDKRFRDPKTAPEAYAEAWAFNYFLLRVHADKYTAYLQELATQTPLVTEDPAKRLADFKKHFGEDLAKLDAEFLAHIKKIK